MRWQNYRKQKDAKPVWSEEACFRRIYELLSELKDMHSVGASIREIAKEFWWKVRCALENLEPVPAVMTWLFLAKHWGELLSGEFRELKNVLEPGPDGTE